MGEEALVENKITDGIALIRELDSRGQPPSLAAWYFYQDVDQWRLLIAAPAFDSDLPKQEVLAYRKVAEAISSKNISSLGISEVKILRTDATLPTALRFLMRTAPDGIVRAYFTDTTLNGIFIKEMIILRSS